MALKLGPTGIVRNNISFYVDFSNRKSFSPNLLNYSIWATGSNTGISTNSSLYGTTGYFILSANSGRPTETERILSIDPFGYTNSIVWTAISRDHEDQLVEPEGLAFINAAGITEKYQINAIHELVWFLKYHGLWAKMKAIYPFIGGTENTHKYNLINPQTFTLSFYGGVSHSLYGVSPNGIDGYAKTGIIPQRDLIENNTHMSFYSITSNASTNSEATTMGAFSGVTSSMTLSIRKTSNQSESGLTSDYSSSSLSDKNNTIYTENTDARYLYVSSRSSSTNFVLRRVSPTFLTGGVRDILSFTSSVASSQKLPNSELLLFACGDSNGQPIASSYDNHDSIFITIGNSLTSTDVSNLHYLIENYFIKISTPYSSVLRRPRHGSSVVDTTFLHSQDDGGWNTDFFEIDNRKMYRFSTWVKRSEILPNCSFYLGTYIYNTNRSILNLISKVSGGTTSNPYFHAGTKIAENQSDDLNWSLVVGHVWPYNSPVGVTVSGTGGWNFSPDITTRARRSHPDSGVWQRSGKVGGINTGDWKWTIDGKYSRHRSYLYYGTHSMTQSFIYPRVDIVDGFEPTIAELLEGPEPIKDLSPNGNKIYAINNTNFSKSLDSLIFKDSRNVICGTVSTPFSANSISIWFMLDNIVGKDYPGFTLFGFKRPSSPTPFALYLGNTTNYIDNEVITIAENTSGVNRTSVTDIPSLNRNTWYNIVLNWNLVDNKYDIYLNGIKQITTSGTANNVTLNNDVRYVSIGSTSYTNPFLGKIASLLTYNRGLTDAEILSNYYNGKIKYK